MIKFFCQNTELNKFYYFKISFYLFILRHISPCILGWQGTHYVDQAELDLKDTSLYLSKS